MYDGVKAFRTYVMIHTGEFSIDHFSKEPITKYTSIDGDGSQWIPEAEYERCGRPEKIIFDTRRAHFKVRKYFPLATIVHKII